MMGKKVGCRLAAHISFENARLGAGEVDIHESVDGVAETAVDIECEESRAELQVLPQQNWHSLAIEFQIADDFINVLRLELKLGRRRPGMQSKWILGAGQFRQFRSKMIGSEKLDHELPREQLVVVADADRPE